MTEHIPKKRLHELANLPVVVDQSEWHEHIRHCQECSIQFLQFLKDIIEAKRNKSDDPAA